MPVYHNRLPIRDSDDHPGFVYFLQAGPDGPIKIGHTTQPSIRIPELQTASPFELRLLRLVVGGRDLERHLHNAVAEHRLKGEWFEDCDQVRDAIKSTVSARGVVAVCDHCHARAILDPTGVCMACIEFADDRNSDHDPFDDSLPRDIAA